MKTELIEWIGEARILPGFGEVTAGDKIDLPASRAASHVAQHQARYVKQQQQPKKEVKTDG